MKIPIIKKIILICNIPRAIPAFVLKNCVGTLLEKDIERGIMHHHYKCSRTIAFLYLMTFDPWFRTLFYFRIRKWKYLISWLMPPHKSFVIGTYADIGAGFLGIHPIGSYVNARKIGENFTIRNNTVIGDKGGTPMIGDNVSIGVNSVVIGKITIGNNVQIGAGTVLTKDVPDNCVVVGNPAFILKQDSIRVNRKL